MNPKAILLAVGFCVASSAFAFATSSTTNGNKLYEYCGEGQADLNWGYCVGYIVGISDAMAAGGSVNGFTACFPPGITTWQIRDVAINFLKNNPADRNDAAAGLVAASIAEAWPCH